MMRFLRTDLLVAVIAVGLAVLPAMPAAAYVGPGAGLSAIGTLIAVVAAVFLAIVGFVWYPMKRILRHRKAAAQSAEAAATEKDKAASQTGTEE